MLINLSNHPVANWSSEQKNMAEQQFGKVVDIPFPAIDPYSDAPALKKLAQTYVDQIMSLNPTTVHIMGELTFTFYLVKSLQALGVHCIASTTNRLVTEKDNLTKVTTFQFAGFRPYF